MKTRIFLTTLMLIVASYMVTEASGTKANDTLNPSTIENSIEPNLTAGTQTAEGIYTSPVGQGITFENGMNKTGIEMANAESVVNNSLLNDWISSRNNWEDTGNDMISTESVVENSLLGNWITCRDDWEQNKDNMELLKEWMISRDSWEQK